MNPTLNPSDLALLVKDTVDAALLALVIPDGFECTVDARLEADVPWGVTVTIRWPEGVEVLSRDKLAAERRLLLLGQPMGSATQGSATQGFPRSGSATQGFPRSGSATEPLECWLPLSNDATALQIYLQDAATGACQKYDGEQSIACEVAFDERMLKEERKKILQSMKTTKVETNSLYGEFGPATGERKIP